MLDSDDGETSRRFNGVVLEARLLTEGKTTETRLYATDIGKGGLFLEMTNPPPIGAVVRVLLAVLPGKMMPLDGRVMKVVSAAEARTLGTLPGVGLKFEGLTMASRELLDRAIEAASAVIVPDPLPDLPMDALEPMPDEAQKPAPSFLVRRMVDGYKSKIDERAKRGREFFEAAKAAFAAGMWVKASAECQTALTYDSENAEYKELATRAHSKACVAKSGTAWQQGNYFESIGDRKSAAMQFREAATLAPENPDFTRKSAAYAFTDGDLKQARQWVLLALQVRPNDADARSILAMVYEAAGHLHNALREAEKALKLAPDRKDFQHLVGRLKAAS